MTPRGIKPVTFCFVAQHLNHCATADVLIIYLKTQRGIKGKEVWLYHLDSSKFWYRLTEFRTVCLMKCLHWWHNCWTHHSKSQEDCFEGDIGFEGAASLCKLFDRMMHKLIGISACSLHIMSQHPYGYVCLNYEPRGRVWFVSSVRGSKLFCFTQEWLRK